MSPSVHNRELLLLLTAVAMLGKQIRFVLSLQTI